MNDLTIIGAGKIARTINQYVKDRFNVLGFMVANDFINDVTLDGLPVLSIEKSANELISSGCNFLIAIGYAEMNEVRQRIFSDFKEKGAAFINFIHPTCSIARGVEIGYNNVFLENSVVQPFTNVGDNNFFWSNTVFSHGASINHGNWIASGSVIGGDCSIGSQNFLGVNASLSHNVCIGDQNFIGAGCLQANNMGSGQVYVRDNKLECNSNTFLRISGV